MSDTSSGADVFVNTNQDGKQSRPLVILCGEITTVIALVIVNSTYCPSCNAGNLTYQMQTGFGEDIATTEIADYVVDKNYVRDVNMSL